MTQAWRTAHVPQIENHYVERITSAKPLLPVDFQNSGPLLSSEAGRPASTDVNTRPRRNPAHLPHSIAKRILRNFAGQFSAFAKLVFVSKTSAEMTPDGEQHLRRPRHIAAIAQYGRISSKNDAYHDKSIR